MIKNALKNITYNAPVVLSLVLISLVVLGLSSLFGGLNGWFSSPNPMRWANPKDWITSFTWVFGHADMNHYTFNMLIVLLVGPMLEEKYGSRKLLQMVIITAIVTSLINAFIMPMFTSRVSIMGMSGIVFMMVLLSSLVSFKPGEIPLTFVMVAVLYFGRELVEVFGQNNVSQFAHIMGGICGSIFGFTRPKSESVPVLDPSARTGGSGSLGLS